MKTSQQKDFLINILFWAFWIAVAFLGIKYILPITIPFILGFLVAAFVVKISKKIKFENKAVRIILTILFYGTVGLLIALLLIEGFSSLYELVLKLPTFYEKNISPSLEQLSKWAKVTFANLDPEIQNALGMLFDAITSTLKNLFGLISNFIISLVSSVVTAVPSLFLSTLAMLICTFFFVVDFEKINEFYQKYIPEKGKNIVGEIIYYLKNTLFVVIKSYLIIMCLTFTELFILFMLFGIDNAFVIAVIIAIFDIMPILGTGGIVIPWAVISFIMGNPIMGIKLIIIYGIITVVRNYVEPKIVGVQLGLHPIITLVSMFIGLRLFGFLGLFGCPVAISFFWKKYKERNAKPTGEEQNA